MRRQPGFQVDNVGQSGVAPWSLEGGGDSSDKEAVAISIAQEVDVNTRDEQGYTALMIAAEAKNVAVMDLLLRRHGIYVNCHGRDGQTALILAVRSAGISGAGEAVQLLLDRPETWVCSRDTQFRTALAHAAAGQNAEVVRQFLRLQEPLKRPRDSHLLEALLVAQTEGNPDIAQLYGQQ